MQFSSHQIASEKGIEEQFSQVSPLFFTHNSSANPIRFLYCIWKRPSDTKSREQRNSQTPGIPTMDKKMFR